jgi:phosphotransferase system enzyme I (PtsP)
VGLVAARAEPINLDHAPLHKAFKLLPDIGEESFNAFLGTPILHQGKVLGVLVVQQRESRKFNEVEESFLVTIAAQLAGLIAHAKVVGAMAAENQAQEPRYDVHYQGVSSTNGLAIAKAVVIASNKDLDGIPERECADIELEISFFHSCLQQVRDDIKELKDKFKGRLASQELSLFDVYLQMLDDSVLGRDVVELIRSGLWAPSALSLVINQHVRKFQQMDDAYLRERAVDVKDLGLRLLAYLQALEPEQKEYNEPVILIAEELSPSMLSLVPREFLVGLVSQKGSKHSHVAILARSMGIPMILGVTGLPLRKLDRSLLIVDAYQSQVIVNVSDVLLQRYRQALEEESLSNRGLQQFKNLAAETLDKKRIALHVNTALMVDIIHAIDQGAEGVGLYRSEMAFLMGERFPSEEEQRAVYQDQLKLFHPKPVIMRTLDIGGDKSLPYFPISEENPALGWRGIRISLDHPEIFMVQIRAMLKANMGFGNLRILLPMISQVSEFDAAYALIRRAYVELLSEGFELELPKVGVMIEVPSCIYQLQDLQHRADFLSVGSNDLSQYLLAVDRNNPNVAKLYSHYHPAVLRACYDIAQKAKALDMPLSICGELAGEPMAAVLLLAMGYETLSMAAYNLLKVKSLLRFIDSATAEKLLQVVLTLDNAHDIEDYLYRNLADVGVYPLNKPNFTRH